MARIGPVQAGDTQPERGQTSGRSQRKRWNWKPSPIGDVKARYFRRTKTRGWNFADAVVPGACMLPRYYDTKITCHTKVKGKASPLDPDARPYWEARRRERLEACIYSKR